MRPIFLTPLRILTGIAALTVCCIVTAGIIADRIAERYLAGNTASPAIRLHLVHQVIDSLDHARESRRAYLASGDPTYIEAYKAACAQVDAELSQLVREDEAVKYKISHVTELRDTVHDKLWELGAELAATASARQAAGLPPQPPMPLSEWDLSRVQRLLDSLAQEESTDRSSQLESARATTAFHRQLMMGLGTVNVLFLAGVAVCAVQIKKLQALITICAWSRRVRCGSDWIPLEEYLWKRFGLRFSHGISKEEFDKWPASEEPATPPVPIEEVKPSVAA